MRDANRISSIANKIEVIWRKTNPNLRFWQFLEVLVCRYNADHSLTDRKTMNEISMLRMKILKRFSIIS